MVGENVGAQLAAFARKAYGNAHDASGEDDEVGAAQVESGSGDAHSLQTASRVFSALVAVQTVIVALSDAEAVVSAAWFGCVMDQANLLLQVLPTIVPRDVVVKVHQLLHSRGHTSVADLGRDQYHQAMQVCANGGTEAVGQTDCNEELAIARETIRALEERLRVAAEKGDEVAALGSATADDDDAVTISNLRRNKVYPGPVKKPCMVPFYARTDAWALGILSRAMSWSHQDTGRKATFAEKVFQSNVVFFLAIGCVYNMYNMDGGLDPAAVDDDTGITVQNDVEHNVEVLVDEMGRSNIPLGAFDSAEELKKKAKEHLTSKAKIKNLKAAGQNLWTMAPPDKQHNLHVDQYQIYCEIFVPFHDAQTWKGRARTMVD